MVRWLGAGADARCRYALAEPLGIGQSGGASCATPGHARVARPRLVHGCTAPGALRSRARRLPMVAPNLARSAARRSDRVIGRMARVGHHRDDPRAVRRSRLPSYAAGPTPRPISAYLTTVLLCAQSSPAAASRARLLSSPPPMIGVAPSGGAPRVPRARPVGVGIRSFVGRVRSGAPPLAQSLRLVFEEDRYGREAHP